MGYRRPPNRDFHAAREFEEQVGEAIGRYKISKLDSTTEMDFWIPGAFVEVKEKRQVLSSRWHLLPGVEEPDLFVIDELSVRKAAAHYPHAYFVLHDVPQERLFLARVDEVFCGEHVRRNREGKGKWIVNLNDFRPLGSLDQITEAILADQIACDWKRSDCLSQQEIKQI